MDARRLSRLGSCMVLLGALASLGASYQTSNFQVEAPSPALAKQIGDAAETYRRELAIQWLGNELPNWRQLCRIKAHVHPSLGAGGVTSFRFHRGVPYDFRMDITGSQERILDSVLPHEVTHTIFATHFGCPLPRWADEGACTTVEHASEKAKQDQWLIHFLKNGKGIPFRHLFAMRDYPEEMLPLYSQGYSLTRFLIQQGGQRKFIRYVEDGIKTNNWVAATNKHYGYATLGDLQLTWLDWVKQGSPQLSPTDPPRFDLAAMNQPAAPSQQGSTRDAAPAQASAPPRATAPPQLAAAPTANASAGPRPAPLVQGGNRWPAPRDLATATAGGGVEPPNNTGALDPGRSRVGPAAGAPRSPSPAAQPTAPPPMATAAPPNAISPSPTAPPAGYDSWYAAVRDRRIAPSDARPQPERSEVVWEWSSQESAARR